MRQTLRSVSLAVAAGLFLAGCSHIPVSTTTDNAPSTTTTPTTNQATTNASPAGSPFAFGQPTKSAHYESNTPAHGATLAAVPTNVVIDFNFDLTTTSSISVTKDGVDYGAGATTVDTNKLALRRAVNASAPNGLYTVQYSACWPDTSCDEGSSQFAIDRSRAASATDLRGQSALTVRLKDIAFAPQTMLIGAGTTVTWVNDDAVEHYVNTDSHPAHTYFPTQNSRALAQGQTFEQTFTQPGVYPYHCSAHADTMMATIIVD